MKKRTTGWGIAVVSLLLIIASGLGGYFWYQERQEKAAEIAYNNVEKHLSQRTKEECIAAYTQIANKYPATTAANNALYRAGQLYLSTKQYELAITALQKCRPMMDALLEAERNACIGTACFHLGNYKKAIHYYDAAARNAEGEQRACYVLALVDLYMEQKNKKKALTLLREICNLYPDFSKIAEVQKKKVLLEVDMA